MFNVDVYLNIFDKVLEIDPALKPVLDLAIFDQDISTAEICDMIECSGSPSLKASATNRLYRMYIKNCVAFAYQHYQEMGMELDDAIQSCLLSLGETIHRLPACFAQALLSQLKQLIPKPSKVLVKDHKNRHNEWEYRTEDVEFVEFPELMYEPDLCEIAHRNKLKRDLYDSLRMIMYYQNGDINPGGMRCATVLALRFGLFDGHQRTFEEVGDMLGVTRERIRQIEAKGLRYLRAGRARRVLRDYVIPF